MEQQCRLSCCTSQLKAEGQIREADEKDLVGESRFFVYRRRILNAEVFSVCHARGSFWLSC